MEETLEDKEAEDALKKTKRSERSVAAMRAKYKVMSKRLEVVIQFVQVQGSVSKTGGGD